MKLVKILAKQLNHFQWGTFLAAKFQFPITIMILIGVYDLPRTLTVLAIPVIALFLWLVGFLFVRLGFRDEYQKFELNAVSKQIVTEVKKNDSINGTHESGNATH